MKKNIYLRFIFLVSITLLSTGCTVIFQKGRIEDIQRIRQLQNKLQDLAQTQKLLEQRLAQELKNKQVSVSMQDKGLVITFLAEVLFDSGKAELRPESYNILDKVAGILKENVPNNEISIEGHTDSDPIKHSPWKSNWELSLHRALSVLEYLERQGVNPEKMKAVGYGPYRPVAPNTTKENKQLNRRVEIVIIPLKAIKKKPGEEIITPKTFNEEELK